jgi:hypothetical protein
VWKNAERNDMSWLRNTAATVAVVPLALLGTPSVARAADAALYEVTETMKLRGGDVRRQATAALLGTVRVGAPICPASFAAATWTPTGCTLVATAKDNIDVTTGIGPASATFAVVVQDDNRVDGAELVVLEGTLSGTVNLSPVVRDSVPLGFITGTWTATGVGGGKLDGLSGSGTFSGTFRLPFQPPGAAVPMYLMDDGPRPISSQYEYAIGKPTVLLEITFE